MQHNNAPGRYVRSALEEQVQRNATQRCNTKDILKLEPKCNATQRNTTQQCNGKICEKCPRGKVQCNATQQSNTKDILELKPKCNATQCNTTMQQEDM